MVAKLCSLGLGSIPPLAEANPPSLLSSEGNAAVYGRPSKSFHAGIPPRISPFRAQMLLLVLEG